VNAVLAGGVPEEVAPFLCGTRLPAALKKDDGLRPIAVSNLHQRLVGKCAASWVADRATTLLAPYQLVVGVWGGAKAIVHTVQEVLWTNGKKYLLQADFINTFNLADWGVALQEVAWLFPEVLVWTRTYYGAPSLLLFGNTVIMSECSFHQGDPLASLFFAMVLHPVIKRIKREVPTLMVNVWFLDDGSQVGTPEELRVVVIILKEEGPVRGVILSTAAPVKAGKEPKTTIWRQRQGRTLWAGGSRGSAPSAASPCSGRRSA
jgi:hypothetical protein